MDRLLQFLTLATLLLVFTGCKFRSEEEEDILLAKVFDKRLFVSEVKKIVPENIPSEDSILIQNAYVERWIRESLMMHEAEKNIPEDLEIDKLVEDYRASLIMHQYEKSLVENNLDTIIDLVELEAYYEENKSQYLLESIIVQCRFIKLPKEIPDKVYTRIKNEWKSTKENDFSDLEILCNSYASSFFLNDSVWYTLSNIREEMPKGAVNENVSKYNREFQLTDDEYYYFLKILDFRDKKEIAPLTFIQEQASKVILHQRKIALLEKIREDLYERASSRNQIKLFTE